MSEVAAVESLKQRLADEIKRAMKAGPEHKDRLLYARSLHAAIRKREIDTRVDLDDAAVREVIQALVKQRHHSIEQFKAGSRQDLVDKEEAELAFLQSYLPPTLSVEALSELVQAAIAAVGATSMRDQGAVMKHLQPMMDRGVEGRKLSQRVRELLSAVVPSAPR